MQVLEVEATCEEDEELTKFIRNTSSYIGSEKRSKTPVATFKPWSLQSILVFRLQHEWRKRRLWELILSVCIATWFLCFLLSSTLEAESSSEAAGRPTAILRYDCPAEFQTAENVAQAQNDDWYVPDSQRIASSNLSEFFQSFRNTAYDSWGHSYEELKLGMLKWKQASFADLRSGDSIYESACGIGLNLFMTLEILHETLGLNDLIVYGNEYIPLSAQIARKIANGTTDHPQSYLPARGRYGTICPGDSSHLKDFVPANAFDLVYTGYISPLFNPLGLNGSSMDENFAQYKAYCEGATEKEREFAKQAQNRQNDWFAAWVGEMVRIAKPGRPIIVEQVSFPLCVAFFDWGGVEPSFWKDTAKKHRWNVDPSSIVIGNDSVFRKVRGFFQNHLATPTCCQALTFHIST